MKTRCPRCEAKGKDTSGNGLHIYPDGKGYCFKCHSSFSSQQLNGENVQRQPSTLSISQVESFPFGTAPSRKVSEAVAKQYGVRYSVHDETGEPETIFYPTTDGNNVLGFKSRKLPKDFGKSVGKIGTHLFGLNARKPNASVLILTEGEEDCLAMAEMMSNRQSVDVMSLPNGANVNRSVQNELIEIAAEYDKLYLCFDNDEPGRELTTEVGDQLASITPTHVISLNSDNGKDASDYLMGGHDSEMRNAIKAAKLYEPEGIVNGTDIDLDELLVPLPEGYKIPFVGLQSKLHGLRKGEILTVCAGSGIGKSTLVREIALSLIEQDLSVANVALEDRMDVAAKSLIALDMNIPLPVFNHSPPDKSQVQPHYDKVVANGKTFFWRHFAGIQSQSLMNKLYYYARTKQVDFIILDHLSLVISASESQNERKDIDTLMTQLAKLVVETGVGLIQIVHLKRTSGDKSFAKGGEVELTDLRGSAAIEQLSWGVVGLERDQQGDDRDFSRARVLKNRTWGFTGLADELKFDPITGRMASVTKEAVIENDTPTPPPTPELTTNDEFHSTLSSILN